MKMIWLIALVGILVFGIRPALADEEVAKFHDSGQTVTGSSCAREAGNYYRVVHPYQPRSSECPPFPTFRVYRIDEIDSKLATQRDQVNELGKALRQEAGALKQNVLDEVTKSLNALSSQLFTKEIKDALVLDISTRLQHTLDERIAAMKSQIEEDIMAKIEQSLKSNPH